MTQDVLKLALEALEATTVDVKTTPTAYEAQRQAITAIKEALAHKDPPQRPWVGLTTEEWKEISMANRPYVVDMVVALEARLKQKNGYAEENT